MNVVDYSEFTELEVFIQQWKSRAMQSSFTPSVLSARI